MIKLCNIIAALAAISLVILPILKLLGAEFSWLWLLLPAGIDILWGGLIAYILFWALSHWH